MASTSDKRHPPVPADVAAERAAWAERTNKSKDRREAFHTSALDVDAVYTPSDAVLAELAERVAAIDVLGALAEVAVRNNYVRPVVDDSHTLDIEAGRHPVIERMNLGERFVPNDTKLDRDEQQLLMISGPNMAGKSTVMRQVAL